MTKKVALFVDNGGEELELIAPLDIMRRANLEVDRSRKPVSHSARR